MQWQTLFYQHNTSISDPISAPMKINYKMLTDKMDDSGFRPIFIRSSINSQAFKYFTGEKYKPADWGIDKMKFKRSHEGWQNANERLSKLSSDLETAEHNFKLQRIIPTPQQLKDCIAPQSSKTENVVSYSIADVYDRFLIDSANQGKSWEAPRL
jgi:hypothetical protein